MLRNAWRADLKPNPRILHRTISIASIPRCKLDESDQTAAEKNSTHYDSVAMVNESSYLDLAIYNY